LISGEASKRNPPDPNDKPEIAEMVLPINLIIPNYGPPIFRPALRDFQIKVGDNTPLKFPKMIDPDWEDTPFLLFLDLGKALNFTTGSFPNFMVNPKDNSTDPGVYIITVVISDDNPNPLSSAYSFKITVDPLPPSPTIYVPQNMTRPK